MAAPTELAPLRVPCPLCRQPIHPIAGPGSGPPCRSAIVETFLREIAADAGTRFMTLETMARHCIAAPQFWKGARA